jgi:hypothetical protein
MQLLVDRELKSEVAAEQPRRLSAELARFGRERIGNSWIERQRAVL